MKRHIRYYFQFLVAVTLLFSSCAYHPDVPAPSKKTNSLPAIFPDYCDVTVPCNIAPLNFMLPTGEYEECVARLTTPDGQQQTYGSGVKVQIPEDEWHDMLNVAKGKSIKVEVWGKTVGTEHGNEKGEWLSFSPFEIFVVDEPIDEYVSYRLIEPSYVAWNFMEIAQRNLTSFEETQIFNNEITSIDREKGQCINCHSYQNYKTDNMLFHVRLSNAGTVIVNDGKVSKVNLKRDYTISSGVYPAWHPTAKLIAFSTNKTRQGFHTLNPNKIEVYDMESDLILYDVATDSVMVVSNDSTLLEVYPTWSPDGKYLYYCKSVPLPEEMSDKDIRTTYPKIQYNIYRRAFDMATLGFGEEELVYDAASQDKSATLPRISPDGHYLLFAQGHYGCFHIRHLEADIVCMPLDEETPSDIDLTKLNSDGFPESYPSWSSNGHWIMCASRRDDSNYCRVYFSYFHKGKAGKAFLLPQEDPEHHTFFLKSYNRPEFMVEPVRISVDEFSRVFQ
ncbi:MAG: PD40 domain-containing protein [Bacteroidaceae bacterium]|nr:PD40 domain-containing protein [Bacteroidaceae bacterium]